jgi:tRNA nucleotidyltransferase (CCA-adding enzyme)
MPEKKSRDLRIHEVLTEILKKITPSEAEQAETRIFIENVLKVTDEVLKPHGLTRTLAGSYMRDTWLPNKKEFDIFIMFPENYSRDTLEKLGLEIGKKITKKLRGEHVIAYAEHPYVRAKVFTKPVIEDVKRILRKRKEVKKGSSYEIDIVPCYAVKSAEKIKSAVDRTPFHNKWLFDNMSPALASQVRLLKQFSKGIGVYGSDAKVLGVSGYLCELLTIQYKSFKNFLDHASGWEAGQVFIDMEEHHKDDRGKIMKEFKTQPLIVIDPVDPKRNVASNFSPENFVKLVKFSRDFLEKPGEDFFFPEKEKVGVGELKKKMEERGTHMFGVKFRKPDVIDDIIWPQLRRTTRRLASILKEHEFIVMGKDTYCTEKDCILMFEMEVWSLPKIRKLVGPFVFSKKHSDEFISKYAKTGRIWVEGANWVAEVKRAHTEADQKLKDSLKDKKEELQAKGIASHPAEAIAKGFEILEPKDILKLAKKNPGFAEFLKEYFGKRAV